MLKLPFDSRKDAATWRTHRNVLLRFYIFTNFCKIFSFNKDIEGPKVEESEFALVHFGAEGAVEWMQPPVKAAWWPSVCKDGPSQQSAGSEAPCAQHWPDSASRAWKSSDNKDEFNGSNVTYLAMIRVWGSNQEWQRRALARVMTSIIIIGRFNCRSKVWLIYQCVYGPNYSLCQQRLLKGTRFVHPRRWS